MNETPSGERIHIGFFGRRNAGKSSIVNAFTNQKLSIVSDVKGTTTDPVYKSMELLPMGPVMIIDTPGLDDEGELGLLRIEKCLQVMRKVDVALLIVDCINGFTNDDEKLYKLLQERSIPTVVVMNKSDQCLEIKPVLVDGESIPAKNVIYVSALYNMGIDELREKVGHLVISEDRASKRLLPDFVKEGDTVVLVVPVDSAAPKGRLILPQQQTIRACLDLGVTAIVCRESELKSTLNKLKDEPSLVVTDSQAFGFVKDIVPENIPLTGFSVLFSRYKGDLDWQKEGADALDNLSDGDVILIAEGCTHHRQCDDIGTVKMPKWIENYTGKELQFQFVSGTEFPSDLNVLKNYALVVHCGACMLNEREVQFRVGFCKDAGVPITNYGIAIAKMNGILERAIKPLKY